MRRLHSRSLVDEFDSLALGRPTRDRHELFSELRKHAPILYSDKLSAWVVTRYDDVRSVLEHGEFGHVTHGPGMTVLQGGFQAWRGHEHSKKMGIVARRLRSPRALKEEVGAAVEAIARELAAGLPIGRARRWRDDTKILDCEIKKAFERDFLTIGKNGIIYSTYDIGNSATPIL